MLVIYFIAHSEWILHRSRADMVKNLDPRFNVTSVSPLTEYKENIQDAYHNSISWTIDRTKLIDIKGITNLRKILNNFDSNDIVHIFTIKSLYLFIFSTLFFDKKLKVLVSITGLGYLFAETILAKILRNLTKPLIRLRINKVINLIIFQNNDNLSRFVKYSKYKNESRIIPGSGLDTQKFVTKKEKKTKTNVIFVGRLMKEKGIYEYLSIAEKLKNQNNIEFFIAGKPDFGNKSSLNIDEFNKLQNNPHITYLGEINVHQELHNYDVLIQPSYHEGFSRILIESIFAGLFCIVNDIFGMKEIIQMTEFGTTVRNNNIDEYISKINNYLNNEYKVDYEFASKVIESKFSVMAISKQFEEIYDEYT